MIHDSPPALNSAEYAAAFAEVSQLGGNGVIAPTVRTAEQTVIGLFWGYAGSPGVVTVLSSGRKRQYEAGW